MESDIGNPIEYNPDIDPLVQEENEKNSQQMPPEQQQYYFQPPEMNYGYPPPQEKELDTDAISAVLAGKGAGVTPPVLGPYYAVASHRRGSDERWLHVLGQSPRTGTTIRAVTGAGSHGNCGPGPDPSSPKEFLRAIRGLVT